MSVGSILGPPFFTCHVAVVSFLLMVIEQFLRRLNMQSMLYDVRRARHVLSQGFRWDNARGQARSNEDGEGRRSVEDVLCKNGISGATMMKFAQKR